MSMRAVLLCLAIAACSKAPQAPAPQPPAAAGGAAAAAPAKPAASGKKSWMGVRFKRDSLAVEQVIAGAPAALAGLRAGDVIVALDGKKVTSSAALTDEIAQQTPGAHVGLRLERDGTEISIEVAVAARPDFVAIQQSLVGQPAPAFALPTLDGAQAQLDQLRGKVVVLDFWATWCGPCQYTIPRLADWHAKFRDVQFIGISSEEQEQIATFVKDKGIPYTIARDDGDNVAATYLVQGIPTLVVIDKAGIVRYLHVGLGDFDQIEALIAKLSS